MAFENTLYVGEDFEGTWVVRAEFWWGRNGREEVEEVGRAVGGGEGGRRWLFLGGAFFFAIFAERWRWLVVGWLLPTAPHRVKKGWRSPTRVSQIVNSHSVISAIVIQSLSILSRP